MHQLKSQLGGFPSMHHIELARFLFLLVALAQPMGQEHALIKLEHAQYPEQNRKAPIVGAWHVKKLAPQVGLEPTTLRLTVAATRITSVAMASYLVEKTGCELCIRQRHMTAFCMLVGTKKGTIFFDLLKEFRLVSSSDLYSVAF
jgi:hypothetical protein